MKLSLFDLHCDTAECIYTDKKELRSNDLAVSLDKLGAYSSYAQIFAFWCNNEYSDEVGFKKFLEASEYFDNQILKNSDNISLCKCAEDIKAAILQGKHIAIKSIEDARILASDMSRFDVLRDQGVRLMTLTWAGYTCVGGSFDTDSGLSDFGKSLVSRGLTDGIIPDVSHASYESASDALDIAEAFACPIIASHSNAFSVCNHPRNLRDEHFIRIRDLGGIVGVSLCPYHLTHDESGADVDSVVRHVEHYLTLGGEDTVCIGADLDGTCLPRGFSDVSDTAKIASRLKELGYNDTLIEKIFYRNAYDFFVKNLK